jgi:membrane protease YdiL (CAAX protease family)
MLFHLFVYGSDPSSLVAVFVGGFLICYADYKTRRMATGMLTHISVNLVASGLVIVRPVAISLLMFGVVPAIIALPIVGGSIMATAIIKKASLRGVQIAVH